MTDSTHDPIARQHDDEPRFPLLARDPLAPRMVALWAALRGRKIERVGDIVRNLVVTAGQLPYRPDADPAHVQSAHQIANLMVNWRYVHMPKVPSNARGVALDLDQLEKEGQGTNAQQESPNQTQDPGAAPVVAPGSPLEIAT